MGIGSNLKRILEEKNMKVSELARESGVVPQTLYAIIKRDSTKIDSTILGRIISTLDIDAEDLINSPSQLTVSSEVRNKYKDVSDGDLIDVLKKLDEDSLKKMENFLNFLISEQEKK